MIDKTLVQLRSTRDLRAEMIALAAELATSEEHGRLLVKSPVISPMTVQAEWDRMLVAVAPHVRDRIALVIELGTDAGPPQTRTPVQIVRITKANYRYEILRILLESDLSGEAPPSIQDLISDIGASQTPVRAALEELKSSGLVRVGLRGLQIKAEDVSLEALARIRAMPQTVRFRFELGTAIKSPGALLERAKALFQSTSGAAWRTFALSGIPAAQIDTPAIDIVGTPRLDLVALVNRRQKTFDAEVMRLLDDGLEPQQSVLEPAPVVVTLVRSPVIKIRQEATSGLRLASRSDVFLSLLDLGLREQARQYLRGIRA